MDEPGFAHIEQLAKHGDLAGLRLWLAGGGDANLVNRYGWTPLMVAAMHGRTDFVEVLLAAGADGGSRNDFGDTAISLAELKGFEHTVLALRKGT